MNDFTLPVIFDGIAETIKNCNSLAFSPWVSFSWIDIYSNSLFKIPMSMRCSAFRLFEFHLMTFGFILWNVLYKIYIKERRKPKKNQSKVNFKQRTFSKLGQTPLMISPRNLISMNTGGLNFITKSIRKRNYSGRKVMPSYERRMKMEFKNLSKNSFSKNQSQLDEFFYCIQNG